MQTISTWAAANGVPLHSQSAIERLSGAYRALFSGNPTREDAEIVLVDLAGTSRFYDVIKPEAPPHYLANMEGRRAVMCRILDCITDPRILGELHIASLREETGTPTEETS